MPTLYETVGYKNTGFNGVDIPDDPALLELTGKIPLNALFLRQNENIATIRVESDFNTISEVDYIRIGTKYFYVTNITMLSDHTAELELNQDYITSCGGISSIENITGWCTRCHPIRDDLFSNILAEPFSPSEPIIPVYQRVVGSGQPRAYESFVAMTVDMQQLSKKDDVVVYKSTADPSKNVVVPKLPPVSEPTQICLTADSGELRPGAPTYVSLPGTGIYIENEVLKQDINNLRGLGLDGVVSNSFTIPGKYIKQLTVPGQGGYRAIITRMEPIDDGVSGPSFGWDYNNPAAPRQKNLYNKVYNFSKYRIISIVTGDTQVFDPYELWFAPVTSTSYPSPSDTPLFRLTADLSPDGFPLFGPKSRRAEGVTPNNTLSPDSFMNFVKGGTWLKSPIVFDKRSGADIALGLANRNAAMNEYNYWVSALPAVGGIIAAPFTGGASLAVTGAAALKFGADYISHNAQQNYAKTTAELGNVVPPHISFPQATGILAHLDNDFYIVHEILSDMDSWRLNQFFIDFGYSQSKPADIKDLNSRVGFNFFKGENLTVESPYNSRYNRKIAEQLEAGVRLWHIPKENTTNIDNKVRV